MPITNNAIDPNDADIKMAIRTKHGYPNSYQYSFKKYNGRDKRFIIDGMIARFSNLPIAEVTQVLIFYDNRTKQEIERYDF